MKLRLYTPDDEAALLELHERHGTNYFFPAPGTISQPQALVLEEGGRLVACATARRTVEAFLLIDPS